MMHSLFANFGGPLFVLKWNGTLCPCLEKQEDRSARQALQLVQGYRVQWDKSSGKLNVAKGMLGGWLGGSGRTSGSTADKDENVVPAKLVWVDGGADQNTPELQVQPIQEEQQENNTTGGGGMRLFRSAGYMKTIPLYEMSKVVATTDTLTLHGKAPPVAANNKKKPSLPTLVTFHIPPSDIPKVHDALQELISYEQRRQEAIPEEDRVVDDGANFLQARTQQAAHFAKREIEMREQRKERETRKAKYVKEAGGLKYTALAMANQQS